jgi:predicted nuclease of restriction endonuclease-like (RecB) superfamily
MDDLVPSAQECLCRIRELLAQGRRQALQAVNTAMVQTYWQIGREIVEEEQRGANRAEYGARLVETLAHQLTNEFGKGFDRSNLWNMRAVYFAFPILDALRRELSWTHYRLLTRVQNPQARNFYEAECANARWSTRELERQISTLLYERLALSRDEAGRQSLAQHGHEIHRPEDLIKDPVVLEFTGLPESSRLQESDLEAALMDHLQKFLLELGKGFAFMGRQQRITLDGDHFYVDLVFYNRLARCFVLVDLKVRKLTHADIGQMQMYVNYYAREMTAEYENPPIGLLLCADKNEAVVRYTLSEDNKQIFAARYQLYLPTEQELQGQLEQERALWDRERSLSSPADADSSKSDTDTDR